jgi:hypothetical protein
MLAGNFCSRMKDANVDVKKRALAEAEKGFNKSVEECKSSAAVEVMQARVHSAMLIQRHQKFCELINEVRLI